MFDWLTYIINWVMNHTSWFKENETWLSGVNNFIAIAGAIISVLGIRKVFNLIAELNSKKNPSSDIISFPFKIIRSRDELLHALFPPIVETSIADHEIPYFPRSVHKEVQRQLRSGRKLILAGHSQTGKTRLAAEFGADFITQGYIVLLLKSDNLLATPIEIPEFLTRHKVLIIIDGIEKYLAKIDHHGQNQLLKSQFNVSEFGRRILQAIEDIEIFVGSRHVFFLGTTRNDVEVWKESNNRISSSGKALSRWSGILVQHVGQINREEAENFVNRLAKMSGISVNPEMRKEIAEKNDGELLPLVLAFRRWQFDKVTTLTSSLIDNFSGDIGQIWIKIYQENIRINPSLKYVYSAMDIANKSNIPLNNTLIEIITYCLRYKSHPFLDNSIKSKSNSRLILLVIRLEYLLSIPTMVFRTFLVKKSINRLRLTEIPYDEGNFYPYDGQVDNAGEHFYRNPISVELMGKIDGPIRNGICEYIVSFINPIVLEYYEHLSYRYSLEETFMDKYTSKESAISTLDMAILLCPGNAYLYHQRAHLLSTANSNIAAVMDFQKAIAIDSRNPNMYRCAAHVYVKAKDYQEALRMADIYNDLTGDIINYSRAKTDIYRALNRYGDALACIDQVISNSAVHPYDYLTRAVIFRGLNAPEAIILENYYHAIKTADKRKKPWMWHDLAHYWVKNKNYSAADEAWEQAIRIHRRDKRHYLCRAQMFSRISNKARVLADCAVVDRMDPENGQVISYRARLDFLDGRYKECKKKLDPIAEAGNLDTYAYVTYTVTLWALGEPYQAYVDGLQKWFKEADSESREEYMVDLTELVGMVPSQRVPRRLLDILE